MQGSAPMVFKMILVGDGGTGKSTFVKRHISGEYVTIYTATLGAEVHTLRFFTKRGEIIFNVWDTAGQEKFGGLRDGYYIGANCAVIMYDVTSRITYKDVEKWIKDIKRVCDNIPVVLVGSKVDLHRKRCRIGKGPHSFARKHGCSYCEISSKSNYNIEKPFLICAQKLLGDANLEFVQVPAKMPPEVIITEEQKREIEAHFTEAIHAKLPDEEDFMDENDDGSAFRQREE